jgi:hypothetical protein
VHKLRQILRKSHKKLRKGSSNVAVGTGYGNSGDRNYEWEDDHDAVIMYLEVINDFIKANLQDEMNEFFGVPKIQQVNDTNN